MFLIISEIYLFLFRTHVKLRISGFIGTTDADFQQLYRKLYPWLDFAALGNTNQHFPHLRLSEQTDETAHGVFRY